MRAAKSWESKCHVWRHWLIRSRAEVEAGCAQGSGAWLSDCYFTLGYFHNALWFGQGGGFWECDGLKYDNSGKNWLKCFWRGFLINPSARMVSTHQACSEQGWPIPCGQLPILGFLSTRLPTMASSAPPAPAFSDLAESEAYRTSCMRRQPWEKSWGVFIQNTRQLGTWQERGHWFWLGDLQPTEVSSSGKQEGWLMWHPSDFAALNGVKGLSSWIISVVTLRPCSLLFSLPLPSLNTLLIIFPTSY